MSDQTHDEGGLAGAEPVYEAVAAALAGAREPDLAGLEPGQARAAMTRALQPGAAQADFVAWLNARVEALSGGRVGVQVRTQEPDAVPSLPVRLVVAGEPFAEPVLLVADERPVRFPMRS